jgi:hypothetical protein
MYEFTCQLAMPEPPPPAMQRLFAALRYDQEQSNRIVGCIAGTVPVADFFAPQNIERILSTAAYSDATLTASPV